MIFVFFYHQVGIFLDQVVGNPAFKLYVKFRAFFSFRLWSKSTLVDSQPGFIQV